MAESVAVIPANGRRLAVHSGGTEPFDEFVVELWDMGSGRYLMLGQGGPLTAFGKTVGGERMRGTGSIAVSEEFAMAWLSMLGLPMVEEEKL